MKPIMRCIEELRSKLEKHRRDDLKEYPTRTIFIDPLLEALGWDVRDPEDVELEYPTIDGKSVDYAPKINRKPVLFVEAKPLNDRLTDVKSITQVVGYAANAGGGRAERELRKLLRRLGLLWIVTIVPRLTAWRSILAAGDIFIHPRPSRSFDPLLLEAMSVGSAVAACKGGVDDLIIDGRTCAVFDPDDELSIYGSLQRLFDKPEYARQLAGGAQEYLRENHSVSKMVAEVLQTYQDAEEWYAL
jgi:glycosyltransferase involved in cell wall biosynthesis